MPGKKRSASTAASAKGKSKAQKTMQLTSAPQAIRNQDASLNVQPAARPRPVPKSKGNTSRNVQAAQTTNMSLNAQAAEAVNGTAPAPLRSSSRVNRGQNGHAQRMHSFVEKTMAPTVRPATAKGALQIPPGLKENHLAPPVKPPRTRSNAPAANLQVEPASTFMPQRPVNTAVASQGPYGFSAGPPTTMQNNAAHEANDTDGAEDANGFLEEEEAPDDNAPIDDDEDQGPDNEYFPDDEEMLGDNQDPARMRISNNVNELDFEIDENSPDADEARNQAFLERYSAPPGEDTDVIMDHRKRNRATRPPTSAHLAQYSMDNDDLEMTGGHDQDDLEDEDNAPPRARPNTRGTGTGAGDPTNLCYYNFDPVLKNILIEGKDAFRVHISTVKGFPNADDDFDDAEQILVDKISMAIQSGKIPDAPEYRVTRPMTSVVFGTGSSQRGTFKTAGRSIVETWYREHIHSTMAPEDEPNQLARQCKIKDNIAKLLDGHSFIHGERDEEGYFSNFGHRAIREMIVAMYYSPRKPIARLAPDAFKDSVPHAAAALAMTVIFNCLQEWQTGTFFPIDFEGDEYNYKWDLFMAAMDATEKHTVHGSRFRALQRGWAQAGVSKMKKPFKNAAVLSLPPKLPVCFD